jgi:hypothetical protein
MQLCNPKNGILEKAIKKPKFESDDEQIKYLTTFGKKLKAFKCNVIPAPSTEEKTTKRNEA